MQLFHLHQNQELERHHKPNAFRLMEGEDALSDYQFGRRSMQHLFCQYCGVQLFARGYIEEIGDYVTVQLAALDNVEPQELISAPVRYSDGRSNHWEVAPNETRHL